MYSSYANKIVVIAGGASGMGEHLARQLANVAKTVIILDRNKSAGTLLAKELGILFETVELTNADQIKRVLRRINKTHGTIDYFFNTAGSFLGGEMRDTPLVDWHAITASNLQPIINATAIVYDIMRGNGRGHIINFASAAGLFPVPVMSVYGATKHAVVGLTLGLRMEAKTFNINVSVVCPTIVKTPLYDTALYGGVDKPKALAWLKNNPKIQLPDKAAQRVVGGVAKNKAIIHTSFNTRLAWTIYRLSPRLYMLFASRAFSTYRKKLRLQK